MDAAHGFEREAIWSNSGVNKIDDDGLAYLINAGHELHTVAAAMRDDQKAVKPRSSMADRDGKLGGARDDAEVKV